MRSHALTLSLVALLLTFGASACGGDASNEPGDASAAVVEQIDETCTSWRETLDEQGEFPVEDFDPENPSPEDLPTVGDYFAAGHPAAESALAELRELSPPADLDAEVAALISALEQALEGSKAQAAAAQAGDAAAFTATLDDAAASHEAVQEASDELGAESCAF
jgi:hypothetical protein